MDFIILLLKYPCESPELHSQISNGDPFSPGEVALPGRDKIDFLLKQRLLLAEPVGAGLNFSWLEVTLCSSSTHIMHHITFYLCLKLSQHLCSSINFWQGEGQENIVPCLENVFEIEAAKQHSHTADSRLI